MPQGRRFTGCGLALVLGVVVHALGCGDGVEEDGESSRFEPDTPGALGPGTPTESPSNDLAGAGNGAAEPGTPATPPPEREVESTFRSPVVTGRYIWTANPESGRVALVDAVTQEVSTAVAGLSPTYLAAIPGTEERALVLNTGSADATLLRRSAGGVLSELDIPTHQNASAWSVGASGRWAIAWSDAAQMGALDPTEGLQDVTVIDLAADPPRPARFSVGYRPRAIHIDASESRAYAVTRDGISVIELGATPRVLDDVTLLSPEEAVAGELGEPVLDDVPFTRDGRFALLRFERASRLKIIELGSGASRVLELPGPVSDADIAGSSSRAVAVMRDAGQVAVFDLAEALADPAAVRLAAFPGEAIGSTALPDAGAAALFFTNASDSDRLVILDTAAADVAAADARRVVSLKAPITAVFPSPEGSHAIALLETQSDSQSAGAFSVVPVGQALPARIQGTDAPPFLVSVAATPAGVRALVTVRDLAAGIFGVYLVRMPSLQVDRIPLSSPPIAAGVLAEDGMAYVAQEHPEGRITFIDLESAQAETLTGFELSERVVDGALP